MSFHVYIVYSRLLNQYYVGHSADLQSRIFRHNNSGSKSTKKTNDWMLVYNEPFETRQEACQREMEIKRKRAEDILNG